VIDGDTVEIRGAGERVRLANIDTAETGDRARCAAERAHAARARDEARRLVAAAEVIEVRRTGRIDRYGRTVGFILLDRRDLGQTLMDRGLARPWRGRREPWCAADGGLLS
jgi:endonuclease YncB( thermonuclease family)